MFKNVKNNFDINKVSKLANDFATNGLKYYFSNGTDKQDLDDLFDILFGTIHSLDEDEKKVMKIILKTSNEYFYKKFMKEIEASITVPLKEVVRELVEIRKEIGLNGKD